MPVNSLKLEPVIVRAAVTSWTATEDLFLSNPNVVCLWKGVIGRKTSLGALGNLDFTLLHQTFTLRAASNDKIFFFSARSLSDSTQNPINLIFLGPLTTPESSWEHEKEWISFFYIRQGSCSENNNISLQGKLQKPPLTLDCYVTSLPQILALSRATRVSMKLLSSRYVYYDAFVPEILTLRIVLDFPQPINPRLFKEALTFFAASIHRMYSLARSEHLRVWSLFPL